MADSLSSSLFGKRHVFAIQIDYEVASTSCSRLARLSYWVQDRRLGSLELYEVMDILIAMKWIRGDCGKRDGGGLCRLSDDLIHNWILATLTSDSEDQLVSSDLPLDVARFNLAFHPTHGACWLFLLSCGSIGRLLLRESESSPLVSVTAPIADLDAAVVDAYACLDSLVSH